MQKGPKKKGKKKKKKKKKRLNLGVHELASFSENHLGMYFFFFFFNLVPLQLN